MSIGNYPDIVSGDNRILGLPVTNFPTALLPVIVWNDTLKKWEIRKLTLTELDLTGLTLDVSQLTDATIPNVGDVLTWDGANFIAQTPSSSGTTELEFLQGKDAVGKLRKVTAGIVATGTALSIVPPIGTTTVIYRAKANGRGNTASICRYDLIVDAVTLDTIEVDFNGASGGTREFIIKGVQLIGNGVKTIQINYTASLNMQSYCTIEAYDL